MVIRDMLKWPVVAIFKLFGLYGLFQLATKGGFLLESGWMKSFNLQLPVDRSGKQLPWFTYPVIEFLQERLNKSMRVFEYGCGASTGWWAEQVNGVVSCEHDEAWYRRVSATAPVNAHLMHVQLEYGGDYARAILNDGGLFEIVVIDGRDRVNCARHAVTALSPDGVIIWDNSDRPEYQAGDVFLQELGFRRIAFGGIAPALPWRSETSIYYRDNNCLGI